MNKEQIAQAIRNCDWSNMQIGNKAILQAACEALEKPSGVAVPEMSDSSRVPDDFRNQATGYRAGWNDCLQRITAAPHPVSGEQKIVAHRLLNCLGEVVTEWHDGAPPKRFTDTCGVVQTDVVVEVAYAAPPAAQDVSGIVAALECIAKTGYGFGGELAEATAAKALAAHRAQAQGGDT